MTLPFTSDKGKDDPHGWVDAAAERLGFVDGCDDTAVCILDTGVNRAHPLLAPVFEAEDLHTIDPDWGSDDHHGHGTEMAGLAVFGDLTPILSSTSAIVLSYVGNR
jgi:subtilisin family serine protease